MKWENKKITGGQGEEEKQGVIEDVRHDQMWKKDKRRERKNRKRSVEKTQEEE